jgi:hypothetical protein
LIKDVGKILTEFCVVREELGQKAMAGDNGANFGECGGLKGDAGALLIVLRLEERLRNKIAEEV